MIALSTHSRYCSSLPDEYPSQLPLTCVKSHPLSRDVEMLTHNYNYPQFQRYSEDTIQRILAMNEGVVRAGRILQQHNGKQDNPIYDREYDIDLGTGTNELYSERKAEVEKDKRAIVDDNGNPKAPEYWSGHDPQVLSLSAMLVNDFYEGRPEFGQLSFPRSRGKRGKDWRGKCEDVALDACTALITMLKTKEVDIKQLSMVSMFCIMHNLTIIVKDPASDFAVEKAKEFEPVMEEFAERWPFARKLDIFNERKRSNVV
ncbi:hypothetical protein FSHL1_000276 [Fusarium sambucinum]